MAYQDLPYQDLIYPEFGAFSVGFNTLTAKFGDGYEQSAPNGLNYAQEKWSVIFKNIDQDTYEEVYAFLKVVGQHETWQAVRYPSEENQLWRVDSEVKVEVVSSTKGYFTISFDAREVFI